MHGERISSFEGIPRDYDEGIKKYQSASASKNGKKRKFGREE